MSLFRTHKPKVTLLFKECLGEIIEKQPDLTIGLAIELAAERAGLPLDDIEALAERLMAENKPVEKPTKPRTQAKGFGAKFMAWLGGLQTDQLCLWVADYDQERASALYCDTDIDLVKAMIELKTSHNWQTLRANFEACLIGFGGSLKDDNELVHEIDMSDKQSVDSMVEMMKRLGL